MCCGGEFKGQAYKSATPPPITLPNARSCYGHEEFVTSEIMNRLEDRSIGLWGKKAQVASYVMCDLLTRAGYFLSLLKCIIAPTQILVHLGCGLNSAKAAFFFPEEKQEKFAVVREAILTSPTVSILDLQKFVGKCVSFALMVPGAPEFGGTAGHTVDLMALDSNAQSDRLGRPLRHYTPYPTPNSAGVDMFRYDPRISPQGHVENAYVFPPINMTSAVPLPLVPRQWKPAAACPECHHPNDHDFRQCQMCAYQRRPFPPPRRSMDIDEEKIKRRLDEVNNMAKNTDYGKKKAALENELVDFLGNIYPPKDLVTASPKDVCAFLVWKDKGGKTTVRNKNCKNYGNKKATGCGCPRRLAAGTVDSLIGQLRSIFANSGRGGDWNDAIGTGNPAAAPKVREYLRVTKAEQADALVQPTQAQPVFFEKLSTICGHIKKKMENPEIKGVTLFNLARDQAFFKTMFFAADRASDLGRCKSEELAWLPKGEGILFNHTFGKTLRDGTSNTFPVLAGKDRSMFSVQAVRAYIRIAQALNVSLNRGYLFRTVSKSGEVVNEPFTYDAAQSRFKAYLTEMGSYEGETLHGLRTASAITMALGGADQTALMSHVGWRSEATARRYMRLDRICHEASPAAILQAQVERRDETRKPAEAATRGQCGVGTFYQQRNCNDYRPLF
ncbi:PREDICTED: uncharacterized protein LOC109472411 [Branchiostoma belcheri]|uniref:Uncharacterized protein LOC109472411 n=1 Tax=Branchiostoma belcheri TaxID=7741 RepID=A0A6P4YEV8_BRABE|nr:PREDICTED: uncharacterized protein LOC109472411 [Branchiostoma belcheri]